MSRKTKLLILTLSIPLIYIIYIFTKNENLTYLALGDGLSLGINSYGISNYSYTDYFKDYLKTKNKLHTYINEFSEKDKTITQLHNDLLINKKVITKNTSYNLKQTIRESDIITLSIGQNDIRNELNNINKEQIFNQDYKQIAQNILDKYMFFLEDLKKYFKGDLYILSTYAKDQDTYKVSKILNKHLQEYCKNNKITYINIEFINQDKYFDNKNSSLPNDNAYHDISKKLIKSWNKNQKNK